MTQPQHLSGGSVTADANCLGPVCEEVQYPVAECRIQVQSAEFANQFHGENLLNAEINKQHSNVGVVIFKVCED